ncbi:MAG: Hsp70 family protein, partial [Bacteroidota bacterium]|nr:Hsp70 family protein [Bacteroidota bacterium]MDX5431883.1 Hsp70 family protein [Bacteroidota bacterium]MDX5470597.1 Hsp70 family protein [Bacteroidota bacterium]
EAEANAESDKKAKEEADKINAADQLIFQTEKQLKDYGDKIPAEKKADIESALTELKSAFEKKDLTLIDAAVERMNKAWEAASQDIYNAQQNAGGEANAEGNAKEGAEDVQDVDFEEVK